ncbi:MAG: bifunctional demethylmenaquinone methyltransferase/2-methoxy-6-polyprenyl-1,4-benzoquinol methylase UbiE [Bacteroidales bacterium]|nr:bifunctional demethylmenaquinone methyltransferase/2-methoxy-6-polyprenyl-1,4-benzoquinol methylase UbiE [Bacteroidales bacterium]MBR6930596.1 bifunctional demethylmenaquinone methyltransferase/2-methoxy-6-polyprenyl-1,4-benzoquinol methylase UbiE [Bacteroidales bacterium]
MSDSPIAAMFDRISPSYDRLNHLLSYNIDKVWRRKTAKIVACYSPKTILDLATGTADLAIALAKRNPQAHIIGTDISEKMLEIGQAKIAKEKLENQIELRLGDATALPFEDNSFDTVTVAFGVRNFENMKQGLSEIHRVLKPNGQTFILEFSMPEKFPIKQVYRLYFKHILPKIGKWVSKDASAYTYLPESVERFPKPLEFLRLLSSAGLTESTMRHFGHSIATLYSVTKSK